MGKVDQLLGGDGPYSKTHCARLGEFLELRRSFGIQHMLYKDKITVLLENYFVIMQE